MNISLDSIVYDTVDNFKYDVAVEANLLTQLMNQNLVTP